MTAPVHTPPRLARLLLTAALPPDRRAAVTTDLDDEYRIYIAPRRRAMSARVWYWRQVLGSIGPAISMRRRRRVQDHDMRPLQSSTQTWLEQTVQDVRFALRFLRARPGFAAAAIATFALGIGATTAIFSTVHGVLLRPLPYRDPQRLVRIWSANPRGIVRNSMSPPDFYDLRDQSQGPHGFESLAAFTAGDTMTLLGGDEPLRTVTSMVSPAMFDMLGVRPARGRQMINADAGAGATSAVWISERLWRTRFNGDPSAVGRSLTLDGIGYVISGVMPAGLDFPSPGTDLWVPMPDSLRGVQRSAHYLDIAGRLSPGVTFDSGLQVLRTVAARLEAQYPATNHGWGITMAGLHDSVVGPVRRPLLTLMAAVCCVLLIACANVASLLLARETARARELAVRTALGATRGRVARQQLVESAVLGLAGGAAGIVLAYWSVELLRNAAAFDLPRIERVRLDARVLLVAAVGTIMTGLLTGVAPAWRAVHTTPNDALRGGRPAGNAPRARRSRTVLVGAQIALTLALTIGAGLLLRSLARVAAVDAGFRADHVLLAQVNLPTPRYEPDRWAAFFGRAVEEVRALPGVEAAGAGAPLPLSGQQGLLRFGLRIDGRPDAVDGRSDRAYLRWATPDYFSAMGIPLLEGRAFSDADVANAAPVAVIDRTLAARHFPEGNAIGQRVRASNDRTWRQVVGIVGAVRQSTLEDAAEPHLYVSQAQNPSPMMTLVVRTNGDPAALAAAVRDRIRQIDPQQPVFNIRTLEDVVAGSVASRRFNALMLGLFAALAAVLTMVGVYGVMAYWVNDSVTEIGVRVALGASRREIMSLVLGRTLRVTMVGAAAGIGLALVGGRLLGGMLYGTRATDPVTFAVAATLVLTASLAASYLPALRALAVDPSETLKGL